MLNGGTPSAAAIEHIHAIQVKGKNPQAETSGLCEWFVNSQDHAFCFWILAKDLDGSPMTDREICNLLCITQSELESAYKSGLEKLRRVPEIEEFLELITESINNRHEDNTVFLPSAFRDKIKNENAQVDGKVDEPKKEKKKIRGGPLHRDGKKVDIYSLSTKHKRDKK